MSSKNILDLQPGAVVCHRATRSEWLVVANHDRVAVGIRHLGSYVRYIENTDEWDIVDEYSTSGSLHPLDLLSAESNIPTLLDRRWQRLRDAGWFFASPENRGKKIGLKMYRPGREATVLVDDGITPLLIHNQVLSICEAVHEAWSTGG